MAADLRGGPHAAAQAFTIGPKLFFNSFNEEMQAAQERYHLWQGIANI